MRVGYTRSGQRTACWNFFSPFSMWVPKIELRLGGKCLYLLPSPSGPRLSFKKKNKTNKERGKAKLYSICNGFIP